MKGLGDRVCILTLKLNKKEVINLVQVYAPTSSYVDEEVEDLYELISKALDDFKGSLNFIIGDFNAKVGKKLTGEKCVGMFGVGERNNRGQMLVEFAAQHNLRIMNTFFKKSSKRKWTWQAPNATVRNEIDYILTSRPHVIKDVRVVTRVNIGSDHRLVIAKMVINTKHERSRMVNKYTINKNHLQKEAEIYQVQLKNRFESLADTSNTESYLEDITKGIVETSECVAGKQSKATKDKLTTGTKQLMQKRRDMKKLGNIQNIEYREVCKTVRKRIREDCRNFMIQEVCSAIESSRSLKKTRRRPREGTSKICCVLDKQGEPITNQDNILGRIEEFYSELYASTSTVHRATPKNNNEPVPDVSSSEVRSALNRMSNDKAIGADKVSIEALKAGGKVIHETLSNAYTKYIRKKKIPEKWKESKLILIHNRNLKNYRPISLLSNMYKLFKKILTHRLQKQLDENQPIEQAGFRSGYSTIDHIHSINQLIEKCTDYHSPYV